MDTEEEEEVITCNKESTSLILLQTLYLLRVKYQVAIKVVQSFRGRPMQLEGQQVKRISSQCIKITLTEL